MSEQTPDPAPPTPDVDTPAGTDTAPPEDTDLGGDDA